MRQPTMFRVRLQAFLRETIDRLASSGASRLPPLRVLATRAGVSYPTMQRAVAALVRSSALSSRQGSGVRLGSPADPVPPSASSLAGGVGPGRLLETQVLSGHWEPGRLLPPRKQLQAQFGMSARALRAALQELAANGYAAPWRRGYRVVPFAGHTGARVVALVLRGGPDNEVVYPSSRTEDMLRSLEVECTRAGVRLVLITADTISGRWGFPGSGSAVLFRPSTVPGLQGYLVWTAAVDDRMLAHLATLLRPTTYPVAVLDEGNARSPLAGLLPYPAYFFALSRTPEHGRQVGRMLVRQGHRRVAWLSVAPDSYWATVRHAGLCRAFESAGMGEAVVSVEGAAADMPTGASEELALFVRDLDRRAASRHRPRFESVTRMFHEDYETLRVMSERRARANRYAPFFDTARRLSRENQCTAWVAASDDLALGALGYLRARGIRVPRDLAVVGFDDSREATEHALTSYNFSAAAYMHAMLRCVLGAAPSLSGRPDAAPTSFEGFVVERGTTAVRTLSRSTSAT